MALWQDFSNVIICDDHHVSLIGIEILLRQYSSKNLQVRTASTGKKVLEILAQQPTDLILMDLGLPDISGLDVIKAIRSVSDTVCILVITGASEAHLLHQVQQLEINGLLRKMGTAENIQDALNFLKLNPDKKYLDPSVIGIIQSTPSEQPLSRREHEVLELMIKGHTSDQIAEKINCSVTTVKTYRTRIMNKSGARNSSEMIAWYLKGNRNHDFSSAI